MPARRTAVLPSRGELRILQALWELESGTVEDVINHDRSPVKPNYKTTQTLLRIMEDKGFVRHSNRGRVFVFEPMVSREQVGRQSVKALLEQNFGGSPTQLVMNLIEGTKVDEPALAELERLIHSYRQKNSAAK